jgi:CheY-like chemotaxis protein
VRNLQIVVLVVEDETLVRISIVAHLEEVGFAVYEAANAEQALALLSRHEGIEALFTDVDMPGGMDGLGLAAAVRDRWPPIGVVVTSGHGEARKEQMPHGSVFVAKPYDPDRVVSAQKVVANQPAR